MGNIYETDRLVAEYLLFHYGTPEDVMPWDFGPREAVDFARRCGQELFDRDTLPAQARGLDIGCAVGRSSLEMAAYCAEVVGIDFSHAFAEAATQVAAQGEARFAIKEVGDIMREVTVPVPPPAGKVHFAQGDAMNLRADLGSFDCVLAANLLCRLTEPRQFLDRLPELVKPGGQLAITTPNTWLEEFTAKEYWLGATPATGEPLEAIRAALEPAFELVETRDMPFLIREHRRKYQWSVAQASRWVRR